MRTIESKKYKKIAGKYERGKRDGTGPYIGSHKRKKQEEDGKSDEEVRGKRRQRGKESSFKKTIIESKKYAQAAKGYLHIEPSSEKGFYDVFMSAHSQPNLGGQILKQKMSLEEAQQFAKERAAQWGYEVIEQPQSSRERYDQWLDESNTPASVPEDVQKMDRMNLAQALYWFCSDYHEGQWSEKYSVLSTLGYKPGAMEKGIDKGDYEQQEVYKRLESGEINPSSLKEFILKQYD